MESDYTEEFRALTTRWRRGRQLGLVHLLLVPILIYAGSIPVGWMIDDDPVWYFIVTVALWFVVFIALLLRDRYYRCPRCGTRVRPFGGTEVPNYHPHPCPQCGLTAPSPPY
jgi:hypothetical protein